MTVTCGFFNGADRAANATDVCSIFDGLISDGIYDTIGTAFAVTAAGGNFLNLGIGRAWFNHTWTKNDSIVVYEAPAAELLTHRWDRMVLEVDHSDAVRTNRIFIMKGTPSSTPSLPSLSAGPLKFQYSLAKIYRAAGSTSIAQIDITPEQGTVATPFVNALVEKFDIAAILTQYSDRANELIDDLEASYIGALPYDAVSSNLLINGGFDVWQRGTSQTASGLLSEDRWNNYISGGTSQVHSQQEFTVGQTAVPANPKYYSRTIVTSGNGSADRAIKWQKIEDVTRLSGKTITLSFYAKANAAKNISVEAYQVFGTGGSTEVTAIGVTKTAITAAWVKYTFTIAIPSVSGKTVGANSFTQIGVWMDAGSNFNARTNSLGNQSGTFDFANFQLNYGAVALPFVMRSFADELALCQRYYEKSYEYATVPGTANVLNGLHFTRVFNVAVANGSRWIFGAHPQFKVRKRIAPTVTLYTFSGSSGKWEAPAATLRNSGYVATEGGIVITNNTGGTVTPTEGEAYGHWVADAEL